MRRVSQIFKNFDFYPKTKEDVQQRNAFGAIEWINWRQPIKSSTLFVHTDRGEMMHINFRITFTELPCEVINLDVSDQFGEEQVAIDKNILKDSWKGTVSDIQNFYSNLALKQGILDAGFATKIWEMTKFQQLPPLSGRACQSCYAAERHVGQCCNNCWQLQKAMSEKGFDPKMAFSYAQCKDGNEGCQVSGSITVRRVEGMIHIAVGSSHIENEKHHHHWSQSERSMGFNTTHYVHHFSFTPVQNFISVSPLDGVLFEAPSLGQQQYMMEVVPTRIQKSDGSVSETNQYSFTQHYSPIDTSREITQLPGVFWKYTISPLKIHIEESFTPFSHFLIRLLAIIGGIFSVLTMIYGVTNEAVHAISKKKD